MKVDSVTVRIDKEDVPIIATVQIVVNRPNERSLVVGVDNSETVGGLKQKIQERTGVSPEDQLLYVAGKLLKDNDTIHKIHFSGKNPVGTNTLTVTMKARLRCGLNEIYHSAARVSHAPWTTSHPLGVFKIDKKTLGEMVNAKDLKLLRQLGGVDGVTNDLNSDKENGISDDAEDINYRKDKYGTHQPPATKGLFYFALEQLKHITMLILLSCAALSLGFGIKQDGLKKGWYDGGSIFLAVFIVIAVAAVLNSRMSRQFEKLYKAIENIQVDVVRYGRQQNISIFDVVVGDVIKLKIGDRIPADGLLLVGHSLQVESRMTRKSGDVTIGTRNPFLFSGVNVVNGSGYMIVTAVGMGTAWRGMMRRVRETQESTPLQAQLNKLGVFVGSVALSVGLLILTFLFVHYFSGNTKDDNGRKKFTRTNRKIDDAMNAVVGMIAAASALLVAIIPEGISWAVTLGLSYSTIRMLGDKVLVRKLSACETMGSVTTICTNKTGTLTLNQMEVTEFSVGQEVLNDDDATTRISSSIIQLLQQGVGLNTTGHVVSGFMPEFSGSPTEKAILSWGVSKLGMDMESLKSSNTVLHLEPYNNYGQKRSGLLMKKICDETCHEHWNGNAEVVLASCSNYYTRAGTSEFMSPSDRTRFEHIIKTMGAKSLRCIAFAHKQITKVEDGEESKKKLDGDGLTLLGLVGLIDPCRPGVKNAVGDCKFAGVNVKMITGDNILTARAIAMECGIIMKDQDTSNEIILGEEFRNYSPEERMEKIDRICVMARSSPFDKLLMVQCLKQKGHVVAVTGNGPNDIDALLEADIGISMGIHGTEVAKENSDITILNDDFISIVAFLWWGRCFYNNIQKFIQFHLTVNITALVINFIAAASSGEMPLTTVQLLWVNLIGSTLGALALATERPSNELMKTPPVGRNEPLITNAMWRNLTAQAMYQIVILLILQFKGRSIFQVTGKVKDTMIFNTFVLCQVFNVFNARKLEKRNMFKGLHKNPLFLGTVMITIVVQVLMVELLQKFADTERLDRKKWVACFIIAAVSGTIGCIVKFLPVPYNVVNRTKDDISCHNMKKSLLINPGSTATAVDPETGRVVL